MCGSNSHDLPNDVTREFYKEFNISFANLWKSKTGESIRINQSQIFQSGKKMTSNLPMAPASNIDTWAPGSINRLLNPVETLAVTSQKLFAKPTGQFEIEGTEFRLPRYLFIGPEGGDDAIRLGIFAGIHGDEPAGSHAAVQFLQLLHTRPALATGYRLYVYPVCNPSGYIRNTRCSARGRDLNREFWSNSNEPEVQWLQTEICAHAFHGIISLHSDDTSSGLYGFVRGATLSKNLIEPALDAAGEFLPRNHGKIIDGFPAKKGVIRKGYQGILSSPPKLNPKPFELILETPGTAAINQQEQAFLAALNTILTKYRELMAYAPNI